MAWDERALQEQLTPEQRRAMLRAFADRMLLKLAELEDPKVLADVERDVRVAAAIERIYSRCDRAEKHAPDPNKLEAERADNAAEAIRARLRFTQTYEWGEERRKALGRKWTKAQKHLKSQLKAPEPTNSSPASRGGIESHTAPDLAFSLLPAQSAGRCRASVASRGGGVTDFLPTQMLAPNLGGSNPTTTPSARSPP